MNPAVDDDDFARWLRGLAAQQPYGVDDRLGTANLIDAAARLRAVASISTGAVVSLARPLVEHVSVRGDDRPGFALDTYRNEGLLTFGSDHLELDCHGPHNTHLDALNHIGFDGTWYGGVAPGDPRASSIADLADHGLVTRAVIADVAGWRGGPWVDPDDPVTAEDLEGAVAAAGAVFMPGDALFVSMGRSRYEAAGGVFETADAATPRPGIGRSGAEWIVDNRVSILGWDFLDAVHPREPLCAVHLLIWAIGLVLIDNCDFTAALDGTSDGPNIGALVVAPLRIPGATGATVNPLLVT